MTKQKFSPNERLQRIFNETRAFHQKHGRIDLFEHANKVLINSMSGNMVEPEKFSQNSDRELNERLAYLIMYHPLEFEKAKRARQLPEISSRAGKGRRYGAELYNALEGFCKLRELDESDSIYLKSYAEVLETPKLELLARIADVSIIHDHTADVAASFKGEWGIFHHPHDDWKSARKRIAVKALKIYAPFAEMFGYQRMLNSIREIVYLELNRDYYDFICAQIEDARDKIEKTVTVVKGIMVEFEEKIKEEVNKGCIKKYQMVLREEKSKGSILEKLDRRKDLGDDINNLHDMVAFKFLTDNEESIYHAVGLLKAVIYKHMKFYINQPERDFIKYPKETGYRSYHCDVLSCEPEIMNFEVLLRTFDMDEHAERGGCAHCVYKRGNANLHNSEHMRSYSAIIKALKTGDLQVVEKLRQRVTHPLLASIQIIGRDENTIKGYPITVYRNYTYLDVVAAALIEFEEKSFPIDITSGFTIKKPASVKLSEQISSRDRLELAIQLGTGSFPIYGNVARDLLKFANTVEGAILAKKLAKMTKI